MKFFCIILLNGILLMPLSASDTTNRDMQNLVLNARTDFNDIDSVRHINFDNKNLTDKELQNTLKITSNLVTLSAKYHILTSPQPMSASALTELNLSNGTLKLFPLGSFLELMPLKKINLAYNHIASIASDNDETKYYGWCNNGIQECKYGCCSSALKWQSTTLQELTLNNNQLTELDMHIIDNLPNLTIAHFSDNPLAEVKVVNYIQKRQHCTINLHNAALSLESKNLLELNNKKETSLYGDNKLNGCSVGFLSSFILGFSGCMVYFVNNISTLNPIASGLSAGVLIPAVSFFVGGTIGYNIGHCLTPADKRTYKPFTFDFGPADTTDDVAYVCIEMS